MGRVWDLDLPANKLIVLMALADHADHEGNNVFPSIPLVAWKTGYSANQTRRIMKALTLDGILLEVNRVPGRATKYRIDLAAGKLKPEYTPPKMVALPKRDPSHFGGSTPTMPSLKNDKEPSLEPSKEKSAPKVAVSQLPIKSETAATKPSDHVTGKALESKPPTSAPPPKPNTKEGKFRAEWCAHEQRGEALLKAFGWLAFTHPNEMTRASLEDYLEAAKQLFSCPLEDIPALHKFVSDKAKAGNWSGFGVLTLAKYYPEYQTLKHKPVFTRTVKLFEDIPEPPPLTDAQKLEVKAQLAEARALMGVS
jgi:hypothetical protein